MLIKRTTEKDPDLALVQLEPGESLIVKGQAALIPWSGSIHCSGYILCPNEDWQTCIESTKKWSILLESIHHLCIYPCYSIATHALLVLEHVNRIKKPTFLLQDQVCYEERKRIIVERLWKLWMSLVKDLGGEMRGKTVIGVMSMHWSGLEGLERIYGLNCSGILTERYHKQEMICHGFYKMNDLSMPGLTALHIPKDWKEIGEKILTFDVTLHGHPPMVLVCGARNVGKSTFARYIANVLLNKYPEVAFLDCDLGQSECNTFGLLALHRMTMPMLGPPFTHIKIPFRSVYFGENSPKDDPDRYVNAIEYLFQVYQRELTRNVVSEDGHAYDYGLPLIVNTQGWMRGLGYDMLLHILNKIQPHFICQLVVNENSAVTFPEALMQRMHLLRACMIDVSVQDKVDAAAMFAQQQLQRRQNRFHASDFRHIQLLSNLCATPQSMSTNIQRLIWHCQPLWDFNTKLTEKVPWQIAWKDIDVIILPSDSPIPTSQVLWALNGTVVGLLAPIDGCEREEVISIHQSSDTDLVQLRRELRYEPTRSLPSPDQYTCIGIGLIRGIDPERRMYHLLAPYPLEQLSRVTMLVRGHAELPVWCMVDDSARKTALSNVVNCYGQTIPYVKFGATEGVGALSWRVRHNIMRGGVNR